MISRGENLNLICWYKFVLPPSLLNLHSVFHVFHVSQHQKYAPDPSHVTQMDDVQVRDNLTVEASSLQIDDRKMKHFRGKKTVLVKVVWRGPAEGNITWELQSRMRDSYSGLFRSGNFRGQKFYK